MLLATACGGTATPTPTPAPPRPTVATSTLPPAPTAQTTPVLLPTPAEPTTLTLTATDGAALAASLYPPVPASVGAGSAPGVLLLHSLDNVGGCACRRDWEAFARELQKRGIAVLAVDLRGYGDSAKPADWPKAPGDVRAAWDFLVARPEVDPRNSAIIGASMGANLALIVGANNADVVTVVSLSPGLNYHGVRPAALLSNFGSRPVLLVASQDDAYSYDSVRQMAGQSAALEAYYLTSAGHGTVMFRDAALEPLLMDWLQNHLGILRGK
jgi:alpha-beta hydrolase superfamily lysophospholipase